MNSIHNVLKSIVIIAFLGCPITLLGQNANAMQAIQKNSQTDNSKTEYSIDNKKVSEKSFNKFLSGLTEIKGTWYCAETTTGGRTGYDMKDKNGIVYKYCASSDLNESKISLSKKDVPEFNNGIK